MIDEWRVERAPAVDETCPQRDDDRQDRHHASLEAARRAHPDQRAHEQAQVERPRVDEQSLEDVGMPSQVRPSHAAGVVQMHVRPFEVLAPSPQQGHAPCTADASAIRIDRIAGDGVLRPVASATIRFRDVAPQVEGRQIREHLIAVVPVVRDDLVHHPRVVVGHSGNGQSAAPSPDSGPEPDTGRSSPRIAAANRDRCTVARPQRSAGTAAGCPGSRARRSPSPLPEFALSPEPILPIPAVLASSFFVELESVALDSLMMAPALPLSDALAAQLRVEPHRVPCQALKV